MTALRFYDKAGLLPSPRSAGSGYRTYDLSALPRLRFIRAAQAMGLSLAEIRELIRIQDNGAAPCQHVVDLIQRYQAAARCISELRE